MHFLCSCLCQVFVPLNDNLCNLHQCRLMSTRVASNKKQKPRHITLEQTRWRQAHKIGPSTFVLLGCRRGYGPAIVAADEKHRRRKRGRKVQRRMKVSLARCPLAKVDRSHCVLPLQLHAHARQLITEHSL